MNDFYYRNGVFASLITQFLCPAKRFHTVFPTDAIDAGTFNQICREYFPENGDVATYCLRIAGVIGNDETALNYRDIDTWHNGGEVFHASGEVETEKGRSKFIQKLIYSVSPDLKFDGMLRNLAVLKRLGILTPKIFFAQNGQFIEEHIEHSYDDIALRFAPEVAEEAHKNLARLAATLDKAQINILDFIHQIMFDNEGKVYVVDWGSDIIYSQHKGENFARLEKLIDGKYITTFINEYRGIMTAAETPVQDLETTLMLIKPGFTQHRDSIVAILAEKGISVTQQGTAATSSSFVEGFYAEHLGRPFWGNLIDYMGDGAPGEIIALELTGPNAIKEVRALAGATDTSKADEGTLRARFGLHKETGREPDSFKTLNVVHTSDSPASAVRELAFLKQIGVLKNAQAAAPATPSPKAGSVAGGSAPVSVENKVGFEVC